MYKMTTKIEGYIKKVIYSKLQNNIYDDDQEDTMRKTNVYYVILVALDSEHNEYKIKGTTLVGPEQNDCQQLW